jgi:hypothetical protein
VPAAVSASTRSRGSFTTSRPLTSMTKVLPRVFSPVEPNIRVGSTSGLVDSSSTTCANSAVIGLPPGV